MRAIPVSLIFFLATATLFVLQMIPFIGFFLMILLAMFWSVFLINAGMLGVAAEALSGRVSRWWLVLPIAFYGGYYAFAVADHQALRALSASYDAANARVAVPFDPSRQVIAIDLASDGDDSSWLVQNYGLPVAYSRNPNYRQGYRSTRMIANDVCKEVRGNPALVGAGIQTFGFHDGEYGSATRPTLNRAFCSLTMPEEPTLPMVTVSLHRERIRYGTLPVSRTVTTIATPDGKRFQLLGGVAEPLSWFPMPMMGCWLNSGGPKWQCDAGFKRSGYTPIVSGDTRFSRDSVVLARALGLKRVPIAARKGGDPALVRAKIAELEQAALAQQLAAIDGMIADPTARVKEWQTSVVANNPEILAAKADEIMRGLERAAAVGDENFLKARESGRILAGLIAQLPRERFVAYGPRLLALYRAHFAESTDGRRWERSHWLWETEPLLRRLGDLGPDALFVAIDRRASFSSVNGAGIDAMCRVGAPGKAQSGPALLDQWNKLKPSDREEREALFVALLRTGIAPPAIAERDADRDRRERANTAFGGMVQQRASPMEALIKDWGDVTPATDAGICSPRGRREHARERQAPARKSV